jgi:hypothetical protein
MTYVGIYFCIRWREVTNFSGKRISMVDFLRIGSPGIFSFNSIVTRHTPSYRTGILALVTCHSGGLSRCSSVTYIGLEVAKKAKFRRENRNFLR